VALFCKNVLLFIEFGVGGLCEFLRYCELDAKRRNSWMKSRNWRGFLKMKFRVRKFEIGEKFR
jgi:hypothetical protein